MQIADSIHGHGSGAPEEPILSEFRAQFIYGSQRFDRLRDLPPYGRHCYEKPIQKVRSESALVELKLAAVLGPCVGPGLPVARKGMQPHTAVRLLSSLCRLSRYSRSCGRSSRITGATPNIQLAALPFRRSCAFAADSLCGSCRGQLIKAGLKRWELGETASLIGQLFYAHYLRSGDAHNLTQAHIFYSAIRARGYFNDVGEDFARSAKRLRYFARYIVVALVLNKREVRARGGPSASQTRLAGLCYCWLLPECGFGTR